MLREQTERPELDELVEEHAQLRHILEEIRETLQQRRTSSRTVAGLLRELQQHIAAHFRHEETSGYFTDAVAAAPRLKSTAETLLSQHADLTKMLHDLVQHAESGRLFGESWDELAAKFDAFTAVFREHERGEHALTHEAFQRDLGTDD